MKRELHPGVIAGIVAVVAIIVGVLGFNWLNGATGGETRDVKWEEERAKSAQAFADQYKGGSSPEEAQRSQTNGK